MTAAAAVPERGGGGGRAAPAGAGGTTRRPALGGGGEFDLIRRFLEGWDGDEAAGIRVGPGDDAAVLEAGEGEAALVVTCDLTVEDVHFRRAWIEPAEIGYRAVAVALSDLAAMAAEPVGILVSAAIVPGEADALVGPLRDGIREAAEAARAALLGGDLSRSPGPLVLDVMAVGRAARPLLRSGARAGDELWVTGPLGASAAAVETWLRGEEPAVELRGAFARPRPRIPEARWLAETEGVHALLDLSDGLAGDAGHLAAASGVEVILAAADVPVHPAVEDAVGSREGALDLALRGGEDYELLLAAEPEAGRELADGFGERFGRELVRVGHLREGSPGVLLEEEDGELRAVEDGGHTHFGAAGFGSGGEGGGGSGAPVGSDPSAAPDSRGGPPDREVP